MPVRLLILTVTLLLGSCQQAGHDKHDGPTDPGSETARLNTWLDAEFDEYLSFHPLARTRLGDKRQNDQLDDVSLAAAERELAWRRASVASMQVRFDREALTPEGQRSFDLWTFQLKRQEALAKYPYHDYIFGRYGPQTGLPSSLISYHRVDSLADAEAYVSRLEASGRYLRQYLARAQAAAERDIRAPWFDYERAITEIARVTSGAPFTSDGTSPLWRDFTGKLKALKATGTVTEAQVTALSNQARRAMRNQLLPAYQEISSWLIADKANLPAQAEGVWALPDGEAFYRMRLEYMTTLPLTADEIHQTGLSEVERIHAEMRRIRDQVGFEGNLQAFFRFTWEDAQFYYPNTDDGRAAYLDQARVYLDGMREQLPQYFGILPRGQLQVRRVEAFREQAGGAAHYRRGTPDGSRPGVFYAHLADMGAVSSYSLESLAYHEGLPGHHFQIAIQQELDSVPRFRTFHGYTAFSEGWGLYAEYLGKDMGFYTDPYNDYGRLVGELWRAIRLVVDTGIHAKGWTEQRAIDYAMQNSPRPEGSVRSEVHRYFNNPGQATAYKIGMLKILALRSEARETLGERFSYADFHDQVLGSGPLPMPTLAAKITEWLRE